MPPIIITTFLVDGNPNGIKTSWISNRIMRACLMPRTKLEEAKKREELSRPALYFLLENNGEKAYIGKTNNFAKRSRSHDTEKEFWDLAIIFTASDKSINGTELEFLESAAIEKTKKVGIFNVKWEDGNIQTPRRPNLSESQTSIIEELFGEIKLLISTLGFPIFDEIAEKNKEDLFFCTSGDADAKGFFDKSNNGIKILKGSKILKRESNYLSENNREKRKNALKNRILRDLDEKLFEVVEDINFLNPSAAAIFCLGRSAGGWVEWKNKDGKTLDEIYRK